VRKATTVSEGWIVVLSIKVISIGIAKSQHYCTNIRANIQFKNVVADRGIEPGGLQGGQPRFKQRYRRPSALGERSVLID